MERIIEISGFKLKKPSIEFVSLLSLRYINSQLIFLMCFIFHPLGFGLVSYI